MTNSPPIPPPFWTFAVLAAPPTAPTVVSGRYVSYVCLLPRFGSFLQFVACDWVTFARGRSNSGIRLRVRVKNPRTLVQREFYFTDIWYDTSRTYSTVSIKYFSQATVPLCNIQIWKRDTLTINIFIIYYTYIAQNTYPRVVSGVYGLHSHVLQTPAHCHVLGHPLLTVQSQW